jgi:hypothetical protein
MEDIGNCDEGGCFCRLGWRIGSIKQKPNGMDAVFNPKENKGVVK